MTISSPASAFFADHVPPEVEVIYSGFEIGLAVQSGGTLSSCAPADSPCRRAFEDYEGGENLSRCAIAVRNHVYIFPALDTRVLSRARRARFSFGGVD